MRKIIIVIAFLGFNCKLFAQNAKPIFIELTTEACEKGVCSDTKEYTVATGKYLKIESAITSPFPPNSGKSTVYLNNKILCLYDYIRPPLTVTSPFPVYLPPGKYTFKLVGPQSNSFISGLEY